MGSITTTENLAREAMSLDGRWATPPWMPTGKVSQYDALDTDDTHTAAEARSRRARMAEWSTATRH